MMIEYLVQQIILFFYFDFSFLLGKWVCSECVADGVEVEDAEDNNIVDSTVRSDTGK